MRNIFFYRLAVSLDFYNRTNQINAFCETKQIGRDKKNAMQRDNALLRFALALIFSI